MTQIATAELQAKAKALAVGYVSAMAALVGSAYPAAPAKSLEGTVGAWAFAQALDALVKRYGSEAALVGTGQGFGMHLGQASSFASMTTANAMFTEGVRLGHDLTVKALTPSSPLRS